LICVIVVYLILISRLHDDIQYETHLTYISLFEL